MIGDNKDVKELESEDDFAEFDDTLEMESDSESENTSNVGEPSVEIDVEEIVAELEADMGVKAPDDSASARKKLEALLEERRATRELGDLDELDELAADEA